MVGLGDSVTFYVGDDGIKRYGRVVSMRHRENKYIVVYAVKELKGKVYEIHETVNLPENYRNVRTVQNSLHFILE
jgi:hypothetical protein